MKPISLDILDKKQGALVECNECLEVSIEYNQIQFFGLMIPR